MRSTIQTGSVIKDPDVILAYEKYEAIEPEKLTHPGFDFWMETHWGGAVSLIDRDELLRKSNAELAEYLKGFKETGKWKEPTEEDLSNAFRDCVSRHPERFSTDLEPFLKVKPIYQHSLIWGLCDAWRAGSDYPWDNVLEFISTVVESSEFWEEEFGTESRNYRNRIIGQIADLIGEGTRDDRHAFDGELLPKAEEILLILANKTEPEVTEADDVMNLVLNSPTGRIFAAMMSYSLRYARLYEEEQGERWVKAIKEYFDELLRRPTESPLEFWVTLGRYLPNLNYLDKEWVMANVNQIFPMENEECWKAAYTGYLYSTNAVYKDLYFLLRQNGHYAKGLETGFSDRHAMERIVGHICVGYLEGWENLEDQESLITKLLKNGSIDQFSEIVSFFWMQRDKITDKIRAAIKPLWKNLLEVISQNEEQLKYQELLSDLSRWLSLVEHMDEEVFEWLKLSVKYIETNFNSHFLIEYLVPHAAKTPVLVGETYLNMLELGVYPQYKKENIEEIVRTLYASGNKEIADRICVSYLAKGINFLRSIYEEHMKQKD